MCVCTLRRQLASTERRMWQVWEEGVKGQVNCYRRAEGNPPAMPEYLRELRHAHKLQTTINAILAQ